MKDKLSSIYRYFSLKREGFVSYPITVTILLIVLIVVSVDGSYQIESVEAQSANTSSVSELIERGNSLFDLDKYEEAIVWYDKALAIDPKDVDALYNKGAAPANLGKTDEAFIWIDKALTIDPTNQIALDLKSQLQG